MLSFFLAFGARISLLFFPLFFSSRGARVHPILMVNDPFGSSVFFGSDRRSHTISDRESVFGFSQKTQPTCTCNLVLCF